MKHLIPVILLIIISGCEQKNSGTSEEVNETIFKSLVASAVDSNITANNKLSNLVDYPAVNKIDYNSINSGSIVINDVTYYYALLENPNPLFNRFAVYDSMLTPMLLDKSLNGNIFLDNIKAGEKDFIRINESYLSKDTLVLNRLTLYLINDSGVSLSFKTHTRFSKPETEYFQDIVEISDTLIRTKIKSSNRSAINNNEDNFVFDSALNNYSSSQNIFDNFVKKEIEDFSFGIVKQQIADTTLLKK